MGLRLARQAVRTARWLGTMLLCLLMLACASRSPAPVDDRSHVRGGTAAAALPASGEVVVQRGDTLYGISFRHGLDFRQVAAWNSIRAPYTIYPGQRLRLQPSTQAVISAPPRVATPARDSGRRKGVAGRPPSTSREPSPGQPVTSPATPATVPSSTPAPTVASSPPPASRPAPTQTPARPAPTQTPAPATAPASSPGAPSTNSASGLVWQWPTEGRLLRTFSTADTGRKGIDIVGEPGQPVVAAADGEVVYSGDGLIGYGELIIIKHSPTLLSAYGHNRRRLVNQGDQVRAGQQIAEMGRSGTDRERLHFEIRQNGQPVDPLRFLPRR